jgi:CHAD domain-containing protein/CYTH domain-containing protein
MSNDKTPAHPLPQPNLLLLPAGSALWIVIGGFLADASSAFERMKDPADADALHDFRVAVRRLRSTLRAYSRVLPGSFRPLRKSLGDIAVATGASRDIEVFLAWLAAHAAASEPEEAAKQWLMSRFGEIMSRVQSSGGMVKNDHGDSATSPPGPSLSTFPELRAALENELLRYAPAALPHAGGKTLSALLGRQLADASGELQKRLHKASSRLNEKGLHRARIAGKRMRYVIEPIAHLESDAKAIVEPLKKLQDDIGEMRDAHLFQLEILRMQDPMVPDPPGEQVRSGLLTIVERLKKDEMLAWRRVRSRWNTARARDFFRRSSALADALVAADLLSRGSAEIERKFLLSGLPKRAKSARMVEIDQGWIPGEKFAERLRRVRSGKRSTYYRTVKLGAGVRRIEMEEKTTRAIFNAMWPLTEHKRVSKRRYIVRDNGFVWEIDEFRDRKLVLCEVELDDESENPRMPRWLRPYVVRDVTGEPDYVNRNLAR